MKEIIPRDTLMLHDFTANPSEAGDNVTHNTCLSLICSCYTFFFFLIPCVEIKYFLSDAAGHLSAQVDKECRKSVHSPGGGHSDRKSKGRLAVFLGGKF